MNRLIGTRIEQYQIEAFIGQGRTGTVYRARDLNLGRLVAIKVMQRPPADQPSFQQHVMQVARAASRLNHPSIVNIYHFDNRHDFLYIVMEFVPGLSLDAALRRAGEQNGVIKLNETLYLTAQIADALAHAHSQGLVHRNIRPSNILLKVADLSARGSEPAMRAMLTDFGLGTFEGSSQSYTAETAGTVVYWSPEQCLGSAIDSRADIYSLGVLLYQMTTGSLPFQVQSPTEVVVKHEREPLSALHYLRPGVPSMVNRIIKSALAKSAGERYQDAAEMANALRRAAAMLTEADAVLFAPQGSVISLLPLLEQAEPDQLAPPAFSWDELLPEPPVAPAPLTPPLARQDAARMPPEVPPPPRREAHVAAEPDAILPPLSYGKPPARADQLVIIRPGRVARTISLDRQQLRVGRSRDNDVVLGAPDVSRRHARLEQTTTGWQVVDLHSSGGTYLGERRLTPDLAETWDPAQGLRIGPYVLRWQRARETGHDEPAPVAAAAIEPGTELHQVPEGAAQIYSRTGQFSLVVSPAVLSLASGEQANVQIELFNQGTATGDFRLNVVGLPPDLVTVPQDSVRLVPGARASLPLRIHAPENGRFQAGKHPYQLVVSAASSSAETAVVSGQVIVKPSEHFSMAIWPARLKDGGVCRVFIRNEGNVKTTYSITGRDLNEALNFAGERGRLQLSPGQAKTMALTVSPRHRPLLGRSKLAPFEVNVTSSRGNEQTKRGQVDVQPAVPAWALPVFEIFLVLLFIGTVVFAFLNQNESTGSLLPGQTTTLSGSGAAMAGMPQATGGAALDPGGDEDGDGLSNSEEEAAGTDPYDPDTDGDGLLDSDEIYSFGTDPLVPDIDEKGLDSGAEAGGGAAGDAFGAESDVVATTSPATAVTVDSAPMAPAATGVAPAIATPIPAPTAAPTSIATVIATAMPPAPTAAPHGSSVQLPLVNGGTGWINETGQSGVGPDQPAQAGDGGNNEAIRGFLSFDLSVIPDGATVQSAQLFLPVTGPDLEIQGEPFNELDCLIVDAVEFGLPLNATAYNALAFPITCEDAPPGQIDVLIDAEDAIFAGLDLLQFRFSFEAPTDGDNAADLYVLRTAPRVEVVYTVP